MSTRSHPRSSHTDAAVSRSSASHTDAHSVCRRLCTTRKAFLPESLSNAFYFLSLSKPLGACLSSSLCITAFITHTHGYINSLICMDL